VKALSLRQPWAWAILHAGKRIENRNWNTHYRGPILLHAAKGCTRGEVIEAFDWMTGAGVVEHSDWPGLNNMPRGGIVGRARLVDVIPPGNLPPAFRPDSWSSIDMRWHMDNQFGFVLADVEPLPFVPCKGAQGLFDIDYRPEADASADLEGA
jgi:hypothetical protein